MEVVATNMWDCRLTDSLCPSPPTNPVHPLNVCLEKVSQNK